MDDMNNTEQQAASVPEPGPAETPEVIQPAAGSYWAAHEIVQRSQEEVRRGAAPAYVRRIN